MRSVTFRVVAATNVPFPATPQIALTIEVVADEKERYRSGACWFTRPFASKPGLPSPLRALGARKPDGLASALGAFGLRAKEPPLDETSRPSYPVSKAALTFEVHLPICQPGSRCNGVQVPLRSRVGRGSRSRCSSAVRCSSPEARASRCLTFHETAKHRFASPPPFFDARRTNTFRMRSSSGLRRDMMFERLEGYRRAHGLPCRAHGRH